MQAKPRAYLDAGYTGRASGGVKVAYPSWTESITLAPYVGLYGDYYFNTGDANVAGAAAILPVFDGWSARAIAGIGIQFSDGGQFTVGAERSGSRKWRRPGD